MTDAVRAALPGRTALARSFWLFLCGFLPLVALYYAIGPVAFGDRQAADFHFNYYYAAEAIRSGEDFYPTDGFVVRGEDDLIIDYVYPPLLAIATVPWTLLPIGLAEVLFQILLVVAFVGTLALLDVRDWRCYGLAFLWPPVTDAITTGNVTILLGLAAAAVWRFRDRSLAAGASLGISIATKIFLWPLTIWLAATRRVTAATWSVSIGVAAVLVSWAVVGFRGIADYPDLVRRLTERMDERGYTLYALGLDLGFSSEVARALWGALAVALLAATIVLARRGDERRAFVLALAAAIAFSPIVWLHYFALLLVVIAVVQPRLASVWFIGLPLQLVVTTGVYNGSTFQTAAVLVAAAVTIGLALGRPARDRGRVPVSSPVAAGP
jgi:hypothetical protein